ncbi:MAG: diguanylate cyclase, partial [Singulisphaera sp.]
RQMNPRFRDAVRESDMVARLGGDEFGILLAGEDRAGAARVAERIITSMERSIDVEGQVLEVGVSIGIALYPEHGRDAVTLMRLADVAMYAAKRARVGRAVFAADVGVVNPRRLTLVSELRQAIEGDQLLLHYQPKID